MIDYAPLSNFLLEYKQTNANSLYKPVAVGKYGIRPRESIYSKELAKDYSKNKLIFKDTLTVGMGSNQMDIGVLSTDEIYSVSPAYHTYKIKNIHSKYLDYCLKQRNKDMFSRYVIRGSRQGKSIDFKNWLKYSIPVYDMNEQVQIVEVLDKVCDIKNKLEKLCVLYDCLAKSQFIEMFGDFNFSQKNNDWVKIKNLGLVVGGSTPKTTNESYWNGQYCWITPDELNDDSYIVSDTARHITLEGVRSCSLKPLPVGTVLLSSRAPIGKVAVAGIEMYCNQGFKNIICGDKLNPTYLYCLLKFNVKFLQSLGRGSTFLEVSKSIVENVSIPCPPIELQKDFAFFFEQIDKSKFRLKELQSKLETLYKSLLQKYFG